ncbi:MAG TPA: hypothetical protein GX743_02990 [Actinomycetales bacterium]|nr:hypothetical protein [Actinomycetales bacterium]
MRRHGVPARRWGIALLAGALTITSVAGCSEAADEPPPTTPATQSQAPDPPPTTEAPPDPRAQAEAEGFRVIEQYYADFDQLEQGGFSHQELIAKIIDSLGVNFRETQMDYIRLAQLERWSTQGATHVTNLGLQSYEEAAEYDTFTVRICLDRSGVVGVVDGEPQEGVGPVMALDYHLYQSHSDGAAPRIDGREEAEDAACG